MPLAPLSGIARNFGETFAAHLTDLQEDVWVGPVKSPYGLHLVRVTERVDGHDPDLAEVRDVVLQKWRTEMRDEFQDQAYDQLLAKYEIVLPVSEGGAPKVEPAP
jgi:parvulin-like peptidyl-prolyl isomerase